MTCFLMMLFYLPLRELFWFEILFDLIIYFGQIVSHNFGNNLIRYFGLFLILSLGKSFTLSQI